jgi:hypothetical protein
MKGLRSAAGTAVASIAAIAVLASPAAGAPNGVWRIVSSPSPSEQGNYLTSVASLAPDDVWAVGAWYRPIATPGTLTEHWNGSSWAVVPSPDATQGYNELYGVDGVASNDVWAVGYHNIAEWGSEKTMTLHWDGSAWTIVPSADLGTQANILEDVEAISSSDVWAVGFGNNSGGNTGRAIAEHWTGSRWKLVRPPSPGPGSFLAAVSAASSTDIWAVGGRTGHTLIEHYDGEAWTIVPSPAGGVDGELLAVTARASDDVWASGTDEATGSTLMLHWDGSAWSVVPSPNGPKSENVLDDLAAFGANDVWAVGSSYSDLSVTSQTLAEHWNGIAWSVVPAPNPAGSYNALVGMGGLPGGQVWAVGATGSKTLALRALDGST